MKKTVLFVLLSLALSAEEVRVTGVGTDESSADENAKDQAVKAYQKDLTSCSVIDVDMDNYEVITLDKDNVAESADKYTADYIFDVEPIDASVKEQLLSECKEEHQDRRETRERNQAISDFAGRFHLGVMAYGLAGYGAGAYGEYRHNDFFSVSVTGSYNSIDNSVKSDPYSDTSTWETTAEVVSAGAEIRLLFLHLGYEQVLDYTVASDVTSISEPTGAVTVGLIIPFGKRFGDRFEGGLYYKQYNDEVIINGEEKSNSYMGGFIVRARIF
ncbi:MAG: hypothetical protein WBF77_03375 [Sulfurimonadaceae bacterium]